MRHGSFRNQAIGFALGLVLVGGVAEALMARAFEDPAGAKYALLYGDGPLPATQLWGTSSVVHGVSPCVLGDDAWNLAFNASTPAFYLAWYAEWRRLHPAPRRVYLGLDTFVYRRFPWERRPAQDSAYWPWPRLLAALGRLDADARVAALNRLALIRHRDALQAALARPGGEAYRYLWREACRGFVPLAPVDASRQAGRLAPAGRGVHRRYPHDPAAVAELVAVLDALRADGVAVTAFQPPYFHPARGEDARTNAGLAALLAGRGIAFLGYNDGPDAGFHGQRALFVDNGHLNADGAARFSRRLAQDLRARGAR